MPVYINATYKQCECGSKRFEQKTTCMLNNNMKPDDIKTIYVCMKCGKELK